nr:hypothetical protein BaRGS_018021 [Batillaria attramentaria]
MFFSVHPASQSPHRLESGLWDCSVPYYASFKQHVHSGQAAIFRSVKANVLATDKNQKSKDITIARRLISVAVSDFLCWFPIGLLGLLASAGVPVPGEVNVVMAIFVLPFNSALNPFLYTFNLLMERRREKREKKLLMSLAANMATEQEVLRYEINTGSWAWRVVLDAGFLRVCPIQPHFPPQDLLGRWFLPCSLPQLFSFRIFSGHRMLKMRLRQPFAANWARVVCYSGGSPYDNDIAILKLGSPLQLEDGVTEKVQLNRDSACPQDCAICTVGGWGRTTEGGIPSELPLKVDLPIVNSEECDVPYVEFVGPNSIGPGKVCAGEEVDGESACQGDSGGPVMSNCNGVMEQVGIVSYGIGCARAEYPNVYARVSYYTDWIKDNRV